MDFKNYSAKNVDDAVAAALADLKISADKLEYEVIDKGSTGILCIGARPAHIRARRAFSLDGAAEEFLQDVFKTMDIDVNLVTEFNEEERTISIDLQGDDMGILIGKRGQTLDSLQYLTSLVVNKHTEEYVRIKLDTENYRERRTETLEHLARNIASKVKRTRHAVALEPMNPYERRIIHACLQNDRFVVTASEGEDPYRHVVISPRRMGRGGKESPKED